MRRLWIETLLAAQQGKSYSARVRPCGPEVSMNPCFFCVVPRALRLAVLPVLLLVCSACSSLARVYMVDVDSIAARGLSFAATPAYVFRPKEPDMAGVGAEDLRFREAADLVASCLNSRGMHEVKDMRKADVVVYLAYGVDDERRETRVVESPEIDPFLYHGPLVFRDPFLDDRVRWRREVTTVTTWRCWLDVSAYRLDGKGKPGEQLWSTRAQSRGRSHDLRAVLPWLVEAMRGDFAADTHGVASYEVRVDEGGPTEVIRRQGGRQGD